MPFDHVFVPSDANPTLCRDCLRTLGKDWHVERVLLYVSPATFDEIRRKLIRIGRGGTIDDRAPEITMGEVVLMPTSPESY